LVTAPPKRHAMPTIAIGIDGAASADALPSGRDGPQPLCPPGRWASLRLLVAAGASVETQTAPVELCTIDQLELQRFAACESVCTWQDERFVGLESLARIPRIYRRFQNC
jgi:hypothetical protein